MPSTGKPCHNCRRRRLRCDRSWPSCHKCTQAGQECQGYGKIFTWTQAIDANGSKPGPAVGHRPLSQTSSPLTSSAPDLIGFPSAKAPSAGGSQALGSLTDPLFQDLDRNSRYYLSHFADRVCVDLVARDGPGNNPFRELIPLSKRHPLLLQILIATSAIHWSNIFRPITSIPNGVPDPGGYFAMLRSKDLVSRQALIDALAAKQKAMGYMREVLDTLDPAGSEVALAAMHFFIKFELIDIDQSGRNNWKSHLEGASSIMALLTPGTLGSASSRMLRDNVIADCFIYHILGSTLTSGGLAANIARYAFELLPVMQRVEVTSYLSCPPGILQIILAASQLSSKSRFPDSPLLAADEALSLIDQALCFDIDGWAAQLRRTPSVTDIESRVHIASAHRSAACLYILQALPLVRSVRPVDTRLLVDDILAHLAAIDVDDVYFKATSWPTFIAGAETKDPEKRTWALKRLMEIWERVRWGYIFTAIEMLKATWAVRDSGQGANGGGNWLQDIRGMGFESLIV